MYIVKRNGKKTVRKIFNTYESARHYVRKLIRKGENYKVFDDISAEYRTPSIGIHGYKIERWA